MYISRLMNVISSGSCDSSSPGHLLAVRSVEDASGAGLFVLIVEILGLEAAARPSHFQERVVFISGLRMRTQFSAL